ncbi:hypothetical protein [Clostridium butyricum]|uniref:hypothetical protein n=1 Tax=Clostridium butyricum TaxID=1492 RepID=UPI001FAD8718|nr:hypothetical protein [Clostridium butyricum]MDB2154107.1 hypothetical protein [Clostridium butyricum]
MEALYKLRIDSPYEILEIEDIKIKSIPNEHGYLYLKCLIDDNINERYSVEASTNDKIKVYEETNDKDEEATIFNGIIQNIITIHDNGVYYLEIEALTSSSELDIEEKSRSFQDVEMSYDELINEILKDYNGYSFTQCMDRPQEIGHPLFQYKETDFEFLKRIASYIGIDIHCDIINKNNMFYFGKPVKKELVLGDDIAYKSHQNIGAYNRARAERQINFSSIEYLYYEVKTKISSETGAVVWFKNVEFYVYSYESEYINGELIYTYRLCRKSAVWQEKIHNRKLKGISLEGEVLEVSGEHVKLHLSIDENQEVSKAAWFRYAPPTGNLMYSMPIVGTSARLYFSNEMCVEPIVTGCVRTNGSSCEQFSDTSNRYFVTESDNHLDMLPGAVNFSRPGLSVNLNDDDGISLNSSSSLYAGAGSIILDAGKVLIIAKDKVTIDKNKQSTLSIENECYTDAIGVVYENGSCREAFEAFTDDEPTAGVVAAFGVAAKALLAGAVAGINATFSSLGGESAITAGDNSSIPLEGEELGKREDVEVYDSKKEYKGEYVKTQAGDDTWILGKAYPNGAGSVFVPEDTSAAIEHRGTFLNHVKTFGWAAFNTVNETIDDIKIAKDYVCAAVSSVFNKDAEYNYLSDIEYLKEDKERINEFCKDKSPYKAAYEADNSIINIAMAVDGIGSIFSAPKNAFKAGEALIGGIKVVGASEAVIDMTKISGIALEGVGSAASSIAGALEAGAGIYNMSGGSSGGIGFDDLDLDNASNKQKGNYGEHKADDNLINNQSLKDAGYDLKSVGREAPQNPNDKIVKGIDGLYENMNPDSNIKYVIDEAKFGSSKLGNTKDGVQMSNDWLTGGNTKKSRILKAVDNDKTLATKITRALEKNQVERVLSKVDSAGKVTTYRLNSEGKIIGEWP